MASEDKTYCGRGDRSDMNDSDIYSLAERLGVSVQDILDVMEQVGEDREKVVAYFHDKENSY
jgi:hypothetical protein